MTKTVNAKVLVPEWVNWTAMDFLGTVWGYEYVPGWDEFEGWYCVDGKEGQLFLGVIEENTQETLQRVKSV